MFTVRNMNQQKVDKKQRLYGSDTDPDPDPAETPSIPTPESDRRPSFLQAAREGNSTPHSSPIFSALPQELVVEILSRLSVKDLLQLRCVCKSWNSLISDRKFVKKHLSMSSMDPKLIQHRVVLSYTKPRFNLKSYTVQSISSDLFARGEELKYPLKKNNYRCDLMVGSCDGLLCFAVKQEYVLVWNPAIRVYKKSPCLGNMAREGSYTVFGFGYDCALDDYKVVAVFCYDQGSSSYTTQVKVFTVGTNDWKAIEEFPSGVPYDDLGKFVNGYVNWLANPRDVSVSSEAAFVIVSLDLATESYSQVWQPDYKNKQGFYDCKLGVINDYLCILYESNDRMNWDLWLMKEYGVRDSWTMLWSFTNFLEPFTVQDTNPLCITDNGEILIEIMSTLYFLNTRDGTVRAAEIHLWFQAALYVESMVSLGGCTVTDYP